MSSLAFVEFILSSVYVASKSYSFNSFALTLTNNGLFYCYFCYSGKSLLKRVSDYRTQAVKETYSEIEYAKGMIKSKVVLVLKTIGLAKGQFEANDE